MRIIRDFLSCPPDCKSAVVALGNFDGVHLGHRAILSKTIALAKAAGVASAVMTFEPHPREFFGHHSAPFHIYSLARKLELLRGIGIDIVYLARFNAGFAANPAETFVADILHAQLGASHIVTGHNFAFGKNRQGNSEFLTKRTGELAIGYTAIHPVYDPHENTISSSAIRDALAQGDMRNARAMLGAPYTIDGRVQRGDQRGRTIGFPTANVKLPALITPRFGVYAVRVIFADGSTCRGVANIGIRPTFSASAPLLEVHFFDNDRDVYDQKIRVELLEFIREEQKFDSLDALKAQITRDAVAAKGIPHA